MRLNIKDRKVYCLAKRVAKITGESMTRAVAVALQERLARLQGSRKKMSVNEMLALGLKMREKLKLPIIDHAELLYDERGLPK